MRAIFDTLGKTRDTDRPNCAAEEIRTGDGALWTIKRDVLIYIEHSPRGHEERMLDSDITRTEREGSGLRQAVLMAQQVIKQKESDLSFQVEVERRWQEGTPEKATAEVDLKRIKAELDDARANLVACQTALSDHSNKVSALVSRQSECQAEVVSYTVDPALLWEGEYSVVAQVLTPLKKAS